MAGTSPVIASMSVVLPAPLGPIRNRRSPWNSVEVDAADRLEPVEIDRQAADFEVLGAHADVAAGDRLRELLGVGHDGAHLLCVGLGVAASSGRGGAGLRLRRCSNAASPAKPAGRKPTTTMNSRPWA